MKEKDLSENASKIKLTIFIKTTNLNIYTLRMGQMYPTELEIKDTM